jgi:hypothetical protein
MDQSSDDDTNVPIFTSELGKLKNKYEGSKNNVDDNSDEEDAGMVMDDD